MNKLAVLALLTISQIAMALPAVHEIREITEKRAKAIYASTDVERKETYLGVLASEASKAGNALGLEVNFKKGLLQGDGENCKLLLTVNKATRAKDEAKLKLIGDLSSGVYTVDEANTVAIIAELGPERAELKTKMDKLVESGEHVNDALNIVAAEYAPKVKLTAKEWIERFKRDCI